MSKVYKIIFTDYYFPDIKKEISQLEKLGKIDVIDCNNLFKGKVPSEDQLLEYLQKINALDADAIFVNHAYLSSKFISRLTNCKIILRYGIGIDNIDVVYAKEKGIKVSNVPKYCINEVAENTIAYMITIVRKIYIQNNLLRSQQFDYEKIKPIRRFSDLTVGLIGFGNIGKKVATILKCFNVKIIVFDPYFGQKINFSWVEFVDFSKLLSQSDVISIHVPLNKETYHLINQEAIGKMKKGVFIVNTSRGGIIDEEALYAGLKSGKIAGAGLDVLEYKDENDYVKSKLMGLDNVLITPHTSWYSEKAIYDLQVEAGNIVYQELLMNKNSNKF